MQSRIFEMSAKGPITNHEYEFSGLLSTRARVPNRYFPIASREWLNDEAHVAAFSCCEFHVFFSDEQSSANKDELVPTLLN